MKSKGNQHGMMTIKMCLSAVLLAVTAVLGPGPSMADDAQDARHLVDKARLTLESFMADKDLGPGVRSLMKRAKGVLIYPQVLKGAFLVGISGGSGVLLAHDAKARKWGGPAFYTIGEASFGLQAGGQASEVVLVALTDRGVTALLSTSAKLGADVGVALGPVGAGAEAATANLSVDLVSYSRAQGLYAGISLEGAVVAARDGLNKAYYGKEVTPTAILVRHAVTNPQAAGLIGAVSKAAGK
ncbi:MAG: lipid-binding SYLF domain-containing protein [Sphingomonadaceae bacterium]